MMTFAIGHRNVSAPPFGQERRGPGFTLIELILVMTLLVVVIGIGLPSLAHFFRGRTLDSEARRFLALIRYGQSRAVDEGIPMMLWIDPSRRAYGLEAQPGYTDADTNAVRFTFDKDLTVEAELPAVISLARSNTWTQLGAVTPNRPVIRFLPDGGFSETSPQKIRIRQGRRDALCIAQDITGSRYEIQPDQPPRAR